jgi:cytochrome c551/c552
MKRLCLLVAAIACVAGLQRSPSAAPAPQTSDQDALNKYCVSCHNARLKTGGLSLDDLNPAAVATTRRPGKRLCASCASG